MVACAVTNTDRGLELGNLLLDDDNDLYLVRPGPCEPGDEPSDRLIYIGDIDVWEVIEAKARRMGFDYTQVVELASYAGVCIQ